MAKETVLIADDNEIMRQYLEASLNSIGVNNVIGVSDGSAAIKAFSENEIDIVFLDINMPEMDGMSVLEHLTKNHSNVYAVMVTSHDTQPIIDMALSLGAKGFIAKPLQEEQIREVIDNYRSDQQ